MTSHVTSVAEPDMRVVDHRELLHVAESCFSASGLHRQHVGAAASALVEADLRGVHSHGVQNLPRYCRGLLSGALNPSGECRLLIDAPSLCLLDADNNLGSVACTHAAKLAGERAAKTGACLVAIRNSNHCGAAGHYAMQALKRDQIGLCISNGPAVMAPFGSSSARLGNNPIAVAVPAGTGAPVVLDMACSVAAKGWLRIRARDNQPIPDTWALDAAGLATTDPLAALGGALLPVGGHKGYGLAVVNELLAAVLSLATLSFQIPQAIADAQSLGDSEQKSWLCGQMVGAIDIATIVDVADFKSRLDVFAEALRTAPRAPGVERIYLPGEIEHERRIARLIDGIPLSRTILDQVNAFAHEVGVASVTDISTEKGSNRT